MRKRLLPESLASCSWSVPVRGSGQSLPNGITQAVKQPRCFSVGRATTVLIAARAAKADGLDPVVFLFAREGDVSGEALHHLQAAREAGVRIHTDSDLGKSILHQPLSFCRSRLRRIAWNGLEGSTKASSGGRNRRPQRVFGETSCR